MKQLVLKEKDKLTLASVALLIENDLTKHFSIPELERRFSINAYKLKVGFKQLYGHPLFDYLEVKRFELAKRMLLQSEEPIHRVAKACGYPYATNFTVFFRRRAGMSPLEFRISQGRTNVVPLRSSTDVSTVNANQSPV